MHKTIRCVAVFLFAILFLGISSIAEEITLTTYYPAPYGRYEELEVYKSESDFARFRINGHVFSLKGVNDPIAYVPRLPYLEWRMADNTRAMYLGWGNTTAGSRYVDMYLENTFDLAIRGGNVGIGTTGPQSYAKLEVNTTGDRSIYTMDTANGGLLIGYQGSTIQARTTAHANTQDLILQGWGGDVGIGETNPQAKLHVNGNIKAVLNNIMGESGSNPAAYNTGTDEIGYDIAELFNANTEVEVGDVLVIDETQDIQLRKSDIPYDKTVAGIVSGSPAILFEGSQLEIAPTPGGFTKGTKPPLALCGRVPCKVSIENGPIERGDMLTTSSTPGHAMKATDRDRAFGAILGKALQPFTSGAEGEETGVIVVLVTLQ